MDKVKLFYNPASGRRTLKYNIDVIIEKFQNNGFQIIPYRIDSKEGTRKAMEEVKTGDYKTILVAGGDGTLNEIVNDMLLYDIKIPLGIIPSGTSNDFADYLGLRGDIGAVCDLLLEGSPKAIDVGNINGRYFINVVSGGDLTSVAHRVGWYPKSHLGMIAYFLRGLGELPYMKPFKAEFKWDEGLIEEEFLIFLVLNSSWAGGFKVAPEAEIDDGFFDIFAIKKCPIPEFLTVILSVLRGDHINDKNTMYFKTRSIRISSQWEGVDTDIDGEIGPRFPLDISIIPKGINIIVP